MKIETKTRQVNDKESNSNWKQKKIEKNEGDELSRNAQIWNVWDMNLKKKKQKNWMMDGTSWYWGHMTTLMKQKEING